MKIPKKDSKKDSLLYAELLRIGDLAQEYTDRSKTYKPRKRAAILQEIFTSSKEIKNLFK